LAGSAEVWLASAPGADTVLVGVGAPGKAGATGNGAFSGGGGAGVTGAAAYGVREITPLG